MNSGDIILIKFPFTDISSTKVRPALVISSAQFNTCTQNIICLMITSQDTNVSENDFILNETDAEFNATGLKKKSVFKVGIIHSLQKTLAMRKLGEVGAHTKNEIAKRLRRVVDIF